MPRTLWKESGSCLIKKTDDGGGRPILRINPKYYRPAEVYKLCGDPSLAEKEIGWVRRTDFHGLVKKMYTHDYNLISQ